MRVSEIGLWGQMCLGVALIALCEWIAGIETTVRGLSFFLF